MSESRTPRYATVIFDLDGTLMDSKSGVINAAMHALECLGIPLPPDFVPDSILGPPLRHVIHHTMGIPADKVEEGVALHREYYGSKGFLEAEPYPGLPELLRDLHEAGVKVCIATSKFGPMAEKMLEHFGLSQWILYMAASKGTEINSDKTEMMLDVLRQTGSAAEHTVMIGDTRYDGEGARGAGLPCIGVLYGYGSRASLEQSGVREFAENADDLRKLLFQ